MFVHPFADKLKFKLAELDKLKISTRYKTQKTYRDAVDSAIQEIENRLLGIKNSEKVEEVPSIPKKRSAAFDRLPVGTKFNDVLKSFK